MTLPSLAQVQHTASVAGEILGSIYAACTFIGNPLSRVANTRLASFGHLVLAFGADVAKAKKRLAELFSASETV